MDRDKKPDIVSFQETHSVIDDVFEWDKDFKGKNIFSHGDRQSRGILLHFAQHLNCNIVSSFNDPEGRFIIANVTIDKEPITVVAVYLEPQLSVDVTSGILAEIMERVSQIGNVRVIFCGDFNAVLDPSIDHVRGISHNPRNTMLSTFADTHELTDVWRMLHPDTRRFTCFSTRGVMTHLDLFLCSPSFLTNLEDSWIGTAFGSDHAPIYMSFAFDGNARGRGFWRVPKFLLSDEVYKKLIEAHISKIVQANPAMNPALLWDVVKSEIRRESISYLSQCKKDRETRVADLQLQIQAVEQYRDNFVTDPIQVRHYTEQVKFLQIELYDEVSFICKDSRDYNTARKVYETNRPTKYYFRLPGCRYDCIKKLVSEDGTELYSTSGILKECQKFYQGLYTKPKHPEAFNELLRAKFLAHIPVHLLTEDLFNILNEPVTLAELSQALNKMKVDKSPGMDGLTVSFYRVFWPVVGQLVLDSLRFAYDEGHLSPSQSRGIIRLLPKKDRNPHFVKNWRSITLLNVDYKLLTKSLASRLSLVLPTILGADQRGFVKGRFIGDNIMELYSLIARAEDEDEEGVLMLLDIEKAFDSISWEFLIEIMECFAFPASFVRWIKVMYNRKDVRVLNNGHSSDPIFPTRGVAQGCGLSPLLFILTIETLALSIRNNERIEGYRLDNIHKKLTMLADDMILCLKARQVGFQEVLQTLADFAILSNLSINHSKSSVFRWFKFTLKST